MGIVERGSVELPALIAIAVTAHYGRIDRIYQFTCEYKQLENLGVNKNSSNR